MLMKSLKKKVVLLGFKGDCAGRHYNKILIEMAREKKIDLIFADLGEPKNVLESLTLEETKKLIKEGIIQYLDLQNPADIKKYKNLSNIDVVFIITPDITHCGIVKDLVGKAKRIFIEKPLDSILRNVRLLEDYKDINKIVFLYDHYLGKFFDFQLKTDEWIKQKIIGKISKIEFRLLEPEIIPHHRIAALDTGMIHDLASHGLAILAALPSKWAYPESIILKKIKVLKVKVAKYFKCKIKGTSFAKIDLKIPVGKNAIFCELRVGKGVGKRVDKSLKITGSEGKIFVDIQNYSFVISDLRKRKIQEGKLSQYFAEFFIHSAIDFKKPPSKIPGAMPFESGKEILYILDEMVWKGEPKGRFPKHPVGSSFSEIENIIEKKIKK